MWTSWNFQIYRRLYQVVNVFALGIAYNMNRNISFNWSCFDRARSLPKSFLPPVMSRFIGFLPRKGITMEGTINPFYPRTCPFHSFPPYSLHTSCQLLLHYHIRKERESISMCYVNGCRHFSWTAAWNLFPRCFFLFHPFALLSLSLSLRSLVAFFNVGMLDHRRPKWWIGAGIAKEWMEGKRAEWR